MRCPKSCRASPLLGRSEQAESSLVPQVLDEIGPTVFDDLTDAVANSASVAVVTSGHVERLFQAILHTFTPEERLTISFTTGLKDSPRRPFKLFVLPNDQAIVRQSQRLQRRQRSSTWSAKTSVPAAAAPSRSIDGSRQTLTLLQLPPAAP